MSGIMYDRWKPFSERVGTKGIDILQIIYNIIITVSVYYRRTCLLYDTLLLSDVSIFSQQCCGGLLRDSVKGVLRGIVESNPEGYTISYVLNEKPRGLTTT